MRIAFFSDNFYPELSGITDTIIMTGKELKKRGHEICYVAPQYTPKNYAVAKSPFPQTEAADGIDGMPIFRLPSFPVPSPTGQSRFALPIGTSLTHLETFKPEIIHTQSPYSVGWEAVRAATHFKIPLVGTNHTAAEDFFPAPWLIRPYDAWYYNRCDFVTTPYEGLIKRMREKGFHKPARVIANPVELDTFLPPGEAKKAEVKAELHLPGPVMLYVGRLGVEKNVDVVVRAVARLLPKFPSLTFVMTGHGAAEAGLKKLALELGIEEHLHFAGFVTRKELVRLYAAADVFAMMSTSDSQSISLMQAYASGVPAVCARSRGLPDYTPESSGFLVEPGDVAALARRVTELLEDAPLRARMGEEAARYVKQFSPEAIAIEWEETFKKVASPA